MTLNPLPSPDQQTDPSDREDHDRADIAQDIAERVAGVHEAHGPVEVRERPAKQRVPQGQRDGKSNVFLSPAHAPDCNDKLIGAQV